MYLSSFGKNGVANGTIITHTDVIRGFFNWLEAENSIEKSPMKRVKTMKKEGKIREALTPKDLEILRGGCKTLRETSIFEMLFATGVRVSELVQMDKSDIDWQALKLNVVGKGQKERTVFLNAKAEVHLKNYLESRDDNCDALFVTERKPITRISVASVQREVNIITKRSGLQKNVHPHIFRHTFSTQLLANGASISSISKMLGHNNLSTTEIYSKMSNANIEHEYRKHMSN